MGIAISKLACFIVQEKEGIYLEGTAYLDKDTLSGSHVGYKSCLSDNGKAMGLPSALFFKPDAMAAAPEFFARI